LALSYALRARTAAPWDRLDDEIIGEKNPRTCVQQLCSSERSTHLLYTRNRTTYESGRYVAIKNQNRPGDMREKFGTKAEGANVIRKNIDGNFANVTKPHSGR